LNGSVVLLAIGREHCLQKGSGLYKPYTTHLPVVSSFWLLYELLPGACLQSFQAQVLLPAEQAAFFLSNVYTHFSSAFFGSG
jgi:hypothetical protein